MNKENTHVLGIDIGGTSIKSGVVETDKGKVITKILTIQTPSRSSVVALNKIFNQIQQYFNWNGPVGCGFPGVIKNGIVLTAANLSKNWIGTDLQYQLKSIFHNDVTIINDADAAGIAEMRIGAGQYWNDANKGVVLIITLGTGIGSALFFDGHLIPNTEFGHVEMSGVEAEQIAAAVARENENLSWSEWGNRVHNYLKIMYKLLTPNCIIIGGGVSTSPEKFFKYIDIEVELLPAKMGNRAGIIGAALSLEK